MKVPENDPTILIIYLVKNERAWNSIQRRRFEDPYITSRKGWMGFATRPWVGAYGYFKSIKDVP
jgi:hypothetical protein